MAGILRAVTWLFGVAQLLLAPAPVLAEKGQAMLSVLGVSRAVQALGVGVVAATECWLGVWLAVSGGRRGRKGSAVLLCVLTIALLGSGVTNGWHVRCGCLAGVMTSVLGGVARNIALLCVIGMACIVDRAPSLAVEARHVVTS